MSSSLDKIDSLTGIFMLKTQDFVLMSFGGGMSVEPRLPHMAGRFVASSARDVCTAHEVC